MEDIILLSPCCTCEEFSDASNEKCNDCNGKGKVYIQAFCMGEPDIDIEVCDLCQGKGVYQEGTYQCFHCGTFFKKEQIIQESIVYQDE